jgi:hypothetical protein
MSTAKESNVTAQELADFMNTGWPQPEADWYYDDKNDDLWEQTLQMDPANPERHVAAEPAKLINLNDFEASILYQGQGEDPTRGEGYSLVAMFSKWRSQRSVHTAVVEVPKGRLDDLAAFLTTVKGKIVSSS